MSDLTIGVGERLKWAEAGPSGLACRCFNSGPSAVDPIPAIAICLVESGL